MNQQNDCVQQWKVLVYLYSRSIVIKWYSIDCKTLLLIMHGETPMQHFLAWRVNIKIFTVFISIKRNYHYFFITIFFIYENNKFNLGQLFLFVF